MRRTSLCSFVIALLVTSPALGQLIGLPHIEGSCDLVLYQSGGLMSYAWAQYYNPFGFISAVEMLGTHKIVGNTVVATLAWGVSSGYYSGTREGSSQDGICYQASNTATGYPLGATGSPSANGSWTSAQQGSCSGGGGRNSGGYNPWTDVNLTDTCYAQTLDCMSPLVLNLGSGPVELSGRNDPVFFDLNADGFFDLVSWTAADAHAAFLWYDRNGNGRVDDGSELFGNYSPTRTGHAANGFEALKEFDTNGDGFVDRDDAEWNRLMLWTDGNHDGISTPDEVIALSETPITSIEVRYHWTGRRDRYGNMFRYEGQYHIGAQTKTFYDVYFRLAR